MKFSILIIILNLSNTVFCQVNFDKAPWDNGCDTIDGTQFEMNLCSLERYNIADSILTLQYNLLVNYLDSSYNAEIISTSPADKRELVYITRLKEQKSSLIEVEKKFIEYRDNFTNIVSNEYYGGSIRPLMINIYALEITVNHLRTLIKLSEELIPRK